jgi:hypothetical protein
VILAERAGMGYAELVGSIVDAAASRTRARERLPPVRARVKRSRPAAAERPKLRVGILASEDKALAHGEKRDRIAVAASRGEDRGRLGVVPPLRLGSRSDPGERRPAPHDRRGRGGEADVVFHLAESVEGDARIESLLAALLDGLSIPFTGSAAPTLWNALHKPLAREKLTGAGVPVPAGVHARAPARAAAEGVPAGRRARGGS